MVTTTKQQKTIEWVLRIGIFGTFLGHGIFGLSVKEEWLPLITSLGFSQGFATTALPIIGTVDIIVAFVALIYPIRIILIWATLWAFATALSRPIVGDSIWEFIERTANWATPLALLLLQGLPKKFKDIFIVS